MTKVKSTTVETKLITYVILVALGFDVGLASESVLSLGLP